jgi:hypothetical protein
MAQPAHRREPTVNVSAGRLTEEHCSLPIGIIAFGPGSSQDQWVPRSTVVADLDQALIGLCQTLDTCGCRS